MILRLIKQAVSSRPAAGVVLAAGCAVLTACRPGDSTWLSYDEIFIQAGHDHGHGQEQAPRAPAAQASTSGRIAWTAPAGWQEQPASGMRMGAFSIERDGRSASCTIISLSGPAGGIEANIQRWIGQLGLPALSPDELSALIAGFERMKTVEGLDVLLVDLGNLAKESGGETILAGIYSLPGTTMFIKFSGPAGLIEEERAAFIELCRSVRTGQGADDA